MIKIFLTGPPGIGKSTLINKVIARWPGETCGFLTWFGPDRDKPDRYLYMSDLKKKRIKRVARFCGDSVAEVYLACFNEFGSSLLIPPPGASLIVMDELGRVEGRAEDFKASVFNALDGAIPILGALRYNAHGWLDGVRAHPGVRLLYIDEQNRDNLSDEILAGLGS